MHCKTLYFYQRVNLPLQELGKCIAMMEWCRGGADGMFIIQLSISFTGEGGFYLFSVLCPGIVYICGCSVATR